jgi:hypothetical protein
VVAISAAGRPVMSRQEVDRALASLGAAHERLAAAMYAMDTHPAHTLLAGTNPQGDTAVAWRDAQALMGELWARFTAFGAGLDAARAMRARRSRPSADDLAELTRMVAAPSGPVSGPAAPDDVPLPEAANRITAGCETVTQIFDRVGAAAAAVAARLTPVAAALAEAERLAAELGDPPAGSLGLRVDLAAVSAAAAADPLGADGDAGVASGRSEAEPAVSRPRLQTGTARGPAAELRRLAGTVTATRDRLQAAARVRATLPARLAALDAAVRGVADAEEAVARSYAVVLTKIADPGLPPVPVAAAGLAARLETLARAVPADDGGNSPFGTPGGRPVGSAAYLRLGAEADDLDRDVDAARRRAGDLRAAADGLLDRRAELRGRLDAYRVKGARLGLAEHPDLSERHRLAHNLLYTRPCDLPAATRAVHGYQTLLATLASQEGRTTR